MPMPDATIPQIPADELAHRLDRGERVQLLDIRASEHVARGTVTFGPTPDFRALPASEIYRLPSLEPLGLDPADPVAVICGHGNSSKQATLFLRKKGFDAYSMTGGMAAWETVYLARPLSPTPSLQHVVQLDRVGKGALSYVLVSDGDAVIVDPGRHLERYHTLLQDLGATAAAVVDTHVHADYLSGARAAAERWHVPYFLHPQDARSPYDGADGRFAYQAISDGDTVAFGRATLRVVHVPGHTLGSVTLVADESLALTGDFLFVQSVGRPDLGGQRDTWALLLWQSLERVRREWPGDLLVLPAHYAGERERRADRSVAARFDVVAATNEAVAIQDERTFLAWVSANTPAPPDSYRTIKLANLGLVDVSEADAEILEFGPNQCAVR
ncbi:MAG TPA: MBL fold metallo-hydrolase [Gemmatimonadales bacterium]|nr:MBL fold metallo-hydrolase [Gemmatimonadales bacterium]